MSEYSQIVFLYIFNVCLCLHMRYNHVDIVFYKHLRFIYSIS